MKYLIFLMLVFISGCSNKFQDNFARDYTIRGKLLYDKAVIFNNIYFYKKARAQFKQAVNMNNSKEARMYLDKINKRIK